MYQEIQELIMLKQMHTSHVKTNEQITCEENYCGSFYNLHNFEMTINSHKKIEYKIGCDLWMNNSMMAFEEVEQHIQTGGRILQSDCPYAEISDSLRTRLTRQAETESRHASRKTRTNNVKTRHVSRNTRINNVERNAYITC